MLMFHDAVRIWLMLTTSTCWRTAFYLTAVVCAMSIVDPTLAQGNRRAERVLDDYGALLDSLLPRDLSLTTYAFALRLTPSFRVESQLLVRIESGGRVSAEIARVTGQSAWDSLLDQSNSGRAFSIDGLRIKVERRALDVDLATVQRWQDSLFAASRASIDDLQRRARASRSRRNDTTVIVLDGTLGELWYSQGGVEVHWGPIHVPEAGEKANPDVHVPMARWMTEVMEAAQARARQERPR